MRCASCYLAVLTLLRQQLAPGDLGGGQGVDVVTVDHLRAVIQLGLVTTMCVVAVQVGVSDREDQCVPAKQQTRGCVGTRAIRPHITTSAWPHLLGKVHSATLALTWYCGWSRCCRLVPRALAAAAASSVRARRPKTTGFAAESDRSAKKRVESRAAIVAAKSSTGVARGARNSSAVSAAANCKG